MRTEGVAQVVEHLLSKHKTLNSNPNTAKNMYAYVYVFAVCGGIHW
jgi:hypothetical protein